MQGLRTLRCVRRNATQRKHGQFRNWRKKMQRNVTQWHSWTLTLPSRLHPQVREAWKTSAFEWGVLYSLLWLLRVGVGEGQDIGRRGYALSLPSEFNRASTTIISKKCASLTCSLIFATSERRRRDLTACSSPIFNHPNAYIVSSPICHKKEPSDWLNLTLPCVRTQE